MEEDLLIENLELGQHLDIIADSLGRTLWFDSCRGLLADQSDIPFLWMEKPNNSLGNKSAICGRTQDDSSLSKRGVGDHG